MIIDCRKVDRLFLKKIVNFHPKFYSLNNGNLTTVVPGPSKRGGEEGEARKKRLPWEPRTRGNG